MQKWEDKRKKIFGAEKKGTNKVRKGHNRGRGKEKSIKWMKRYLKKKVVGIGRKGRKNRYRGDRGLLNLDPIIGT